MTAGNQYEAIDDGREVTLRRQFACEWCGQLIDVGERAVSRVYKWEGDFVNARQHPECFAALLLDYNSMENGFTPRSMTRGRID